MEHKKFKRSGKIYITCEKFDCFAYCNGFCKALVEGCDRCDGTCPFFLTLEERSERANKARLRRIRLYEEAMKKQTTEGGDEG